MDAPSVDVVIVNYRSYDELTRCLDSLDPARPYLRHVTVVDHESDLAAAARIADRFPWVYLVERATNEGFATGVNLGARLTGSPFLLLLNPDCVADAHAITELLRFADSRPDAAVIGPRILNADGSVQGSARRFPGLTTAIAGRSSWLTRQFPGNPLSRHNLPALDRRRTPLDVDWVSGACMLVRRTAFEEVGGLDEEFFLYWEDADFCRRLSRCGWRTVYFPGAQIVHAGGRSSIHAFRESLEAFHASAFVLFRKHATPRGRLCSPLVHLVLQIRLRVLLFLHRNRLRASTPERATPAEAKGVARG
ncbi:MAG TPA: glycosyltransferase family 2 protein [Vicinamibacterales bacterium]|nr:glycosyltransferase family 2 protein [Vicinamibacterales bacterium]